MDKEKVKARLGEATAKAKVALSEIRANFKADEGTTGFPKVKSMFVNLWRCGIVGKSALIAAVAIIVFLPLVFGSGVNRSDPKSVAKYAFKVLLAGDAEELSALVGKKFTEEEEIEYESFRLHNDSNFHYTSYEVKDVVLWEKACRILLDCKARDKYEPNDTVVIFLSKTDQSTWSLAGMVSLCWQCFKISFNIDPWTGESMKDHVDNLRDQIRRELRGAR